MVFRRIQQLRISLAAKCQLLFGAAVLLIIAAALFVPWQRIEQLTEQLNERAASAVAEQAVAEHLAGRATWPGTQPASTQPSTRQRAGPTTAPSGRATTRPTTQPQGGAGDVVTPPRLTGLGRRRDNSDLARFEVRAANHFLRERDTKFYSAYYDRKDGSVGYRYAQPVLWGRACVACHAPVAAGTSASQPATTGPAPTTAPAIAADRSLLPLVADPLPDPAEGADDDDRRVDPDRPRPLAGIVVVDFASRIDANQLLLNRVFILTAGTVAGVLAIVTFYFITTRLILQPVRVLQETADKVAKGDLNIRSDIFTGDEFQQLSETFNVMLTNLKGSSDQLRAMNKSLDLKLGQLAESNVALYESNRLKSEFLANVSHELRTPLNSILGFADLLKDSPAAGTDAKTARYANNILMSGRNLLDLINDLLDLAKIEAGKMEVRSEPLSVSDMFEGLANLLKPLLEQKKLTLAVTVGPDVPLLHTDPGKLQQVLYNFLSNAIKFSPAGQTVDLKAVLEADESAATAAVGSPDATDLPPATPRLPRPDRASAPAPADAEPHVRISVTDRGPGIAADQQHVIFEKFRQVEGGHTRVHGGTGLGLAISKELTLLMGGTIGVKSKVGEGAAFWVRLPLKISAGPRDVRARMVMG